MSMKTSHKIIAGTALSLGLVGLGSAAIAAPFNHPTSATPTMSASPGATVPADQLKTVYQPILDARKAVVAAIDKQMAAAPASEKEHLSRMKDRAQHHVDRLQAIIDGKAKVGDGKGPGRDGRGPGGHREGKGHRDGQGPRSDR